MVSQICQTNASKEEIDTPLASFVPQVQSTALQDRTLIGSENKDLSSSEVDTINNITVIEQKISELKFRYNQKRKKNGTTKIYVGD